MTITLTGSSPHDLPYAQSATAEHVDGTVQVTFRVLDEKTQKLAPVRIRLGIQEALALSSQMQPCAMAAEQWRRIHGDS